MRPHLRRPALALAAALLTILLPACADDGGSDDAGSSTTAPAVVSVEVTVRDGSVIGGAQRHEVPLDREVTVTVTADVAEEAHVHGYDHLVELTPGEPASVMPMFSVA